MNRKADRADANAKMSTVGAEYRYSKELRFYASYASVDNDSEAKLAPWTEGRTAVVSTVLGKDTSGLSLGMRYDY